PARTSRRRRRGGIRSPPASASATALKGAAAAAADRAATSSRRSGLPSTPCGATATRRDRSKTRRRSQSSAWSRRGRARVPARSLIAPLKAAFGRLVMILQGDQQALERPQRAERDQQDEREPQRRVDPIRRLVEKFDDQRREHDDEAADQDHEHRRAVAGIGEAVIEAAMVASFPQPEKSREHLALAATRTAAAQAAQDRALDGRRLLTHH